MKDFDALSKVMHAIPRNQFGCCCIICTEPRMKKTNNPFVGRVTKQTKYVNFATGRCYKTAVENRSERVNGKEVEFTTEKPNGKTWFDFPYFLQSDKDSEIKYLRMTMNANTNVRSEYYIDGRKATDEEVEQIKTFLYAQSYSQKQANAGLVNPDDQVVVIDVKVDNIIKVWQGNLVYQK